MGRRAEGWKLVPSKHKSSKMLYVEFRHGGKRRHISTGETDPSRASTQAAQIYTEVVSGRRALSVTPEGVEVLSKRPLDELFAEWLAATEPTIDETTFDIYQIYVHTHFIPFFHSLDILAIGTQDYCRARLRLVKRKTLLKELSALRGALNYFAEKKYLSKVPTIKSPQPKATGKTDNPKARKTEPTILEKHEIEQIIEKLPERYRGALVRARVQFAWETGLRPETISTIRSPEDYHRGQTFLKIRAESDKNRYSRIVPLTDGARAAIDSVCPDVGIIFGKHSFKKQLRKAAKESGLPETTYAHLTAYDLRHSRATYWVEHSQNLAGVAFLLGHKEITTLNRYVRPSNRAAQEVLQQAAMGASNSEIFSPENIKYGEHMASTDELLGKLPIENLSESGSSTCQIPQQKRPPTRGSLGSAKEGSRTPTALRPLEPESSASASSATFATSPSLAWWSDSVKTKVKPAIIYQFYQVVLSISLLL